MIHSSRADSRDDSVRVDAPTKEFSHLDEKGQAKMVDIGFKIKSKRVAVASGGIQVGDLVLNKLASKSMIKGDVITLSKVAGIMGAKSTSDLIPLCHQIPLNSIDVDIVPCRKTGSLVVTARVEADYTTGVEMESLTAVAVTLLTVYDMCKSVNKSMIISEIKLLSKTKSDSK